MSSEDDKIVAVVRNVTGRHIVRDFPEGTGNQAVCFKPDGSVGLTRKEMENMRNPPRGTVVEPYDPKKHGPKAK